jgi:hypothetical protein
MNRFEQGWFKSPNLNRSIHQVQDGDKHQSGVKQTKNNLINCWYAVNLHCNFILW